MKTNTYYPAPHFERNNITTAHVDPPDRRKSYRAHAREKQRRRNAEKFGGGR